MTMASLDEKVLKIITTPIVDMSGIIEGICFCFFLHIESVNPYSTVCNELNSKTDEDVRK